MINLKVYRTRMTVKYGCMPIMDYSIWRAMRLFGIVFFRFVSCIMG